MQRDDHILEEDYVFITKRHGESRYDARQDVQKLSCSVELMSFVDQSVELLINGLPDHLSAGYELGIQLM